MNKKNIIVPALVLSAVLGGTVIWTQIASADESEHASFASRIANRFNLNEDDVISFFEENRSERQERMQERFEERLSQAVENGELTGEQKDLIITKKAELKSEHEENHANRDGKKSTEKDREAHYTKMEEKRTELNSWAKENSIDMKYLFGGKNHGMMR